MLVLIAVGGIAFFSPQINMPGACLFAVGVGSYAVLLLSWHYYRPRASIYAWLLFSAAIAISITVGLVLPAVREGALQPLGALSAMMGFLGSGVAVPLVLSASRLRRWASE